jgi:uncharacterized protein YfiM (DUF2279 family)
MGYALIQLHGAITPEVIMGRKRLIRVVMIFAGFACADSLAFDDKTAHFGLSALFGAGAETVLHYRTDLESVDRVAVGTLLGSVPGLAKEIADSQQDGNEFSGSDLTADVAGAFFGAFLGNLLNSAIQIQVESDGGAQLSVVLGKQF